MEKKGFSRREFLQVGAGAAAGMVTVSFLGCSGGSGGEGTVTASNQAASFQNQHGLTAVFQTTNSSLYRQLLPASLQMPDSLQFIVSIVSYDNVTLPLVPYLDGSVMLSCKYQGQPGMHTLTMPATDKTAEEGGIALGFPKYMADSIVLESVNGSWSGNVVFQGQSVMQITFTSHPGPSTLNRSNPGPSYVNLIPPMVGPQIQTVRIVGQQLVNTTTGSATVTAGPGESWGALLQGATPVGAQLDVITGNWCLVGGIGMSSATVSIARISNGAIGLAVKEAIDLLGGIGAVTLGKQNIMLKPNLTTDSAACTTNPEVIKALAQLMKDEGLNVSIGEGSAACANYNVLNGVVYYTEDEKILDAMQQHVFDILGYTALAQSLGIPMINLHSGTMVPVQVAGGFVFDTIQLHQSLHDTDMLCSVPMMKTHILGGVTLGMKNLIGTYPGTVYGAVRSQVHDKAAKVEGSGVAAAVVDIVRANKLGLVVIDASTAMEGNGPTGGDLVRMNLIIAGTNPLATDMVAANIMGFQPSEIPTFLWANKAGMQPSTLAQIEIRGESISNVQRNFVRPQIVPWSTEQAMFGTQELP
jgi:uncharacterized protein (DUF362 family)